MGFAATDQRQASKLSRIIGLIDRPRWNGTRPSCWTCRLRCLRSRLQGIDVNVRCLDGDMLTRFQVTPFDGQRWEEEVHKIR